MVIKQLGVPAIWIFTLFFLFDFGGCFLWDDNQPPPASCKTAIEIQSIEPTDQLNIEDSLFVYFNQPVDPETCVFSITTVTKDPTDPTVGITWEAENRKAMLELTGLEWNTEYQLEIQAGLSNQDHTCTLGESVTQTLSTKPDIGEGAPILLEHIPNDLETDVSKAQKIQLTWNKKMDSIQGTVDVLVNEQLWEGSQTWNNDQTVWTWFPESIYPALANVTVIVHGDFISYLSHKALDTDIIFHFTVVSEIECSGRDEEVDYIEHREDNNSFNSSLGSAENTQFLVTQDSTFLLQGCINPKNSIQSETSKLYDVDDYLFQTESESSKVLFDLVTFGEPLQAVLKGKNKDGSEIGYATGKTSKSNHLFWLNLEKGEYLIRIFQENGTKPETTYNYLLNLQEITSLFGGCDALIHPFYHELEQDTVINNSFTIHPSNSGSDYTFLRNDSFEPEETSLEIDPTDIESGLEGIIDHHFVIHGNIILPQNLSAESLYLEEDVFQFSIENLVDNASIQLAITLSWDTQFGNLDVALLNSNQKVLVDVSAKGDAGIEEAFWSLTNDTYEVWVGFQKSMTAATEDADILPGMVVPYTLCLHYRFPNSM